MQNLKTILLFFAVILGVVFFILGGMDDSPGLQLIGAIVSVTSGFYFARKLRK